MWIKSIIRITIEIEKVNPRLEPQCKYSSVYVLATPQWFYFCYTVQLYSGHRIGGMEFCPS